MTYVYDILHTQKKKTYFYQNVAIFTLPVDAPPPPPCIKSDNSKKPRPPADQHSGPYSMIVHLPKNHSGLNSPLGWYLTPVNTWSTAAMYHLYPEIPEDHEAHPLQMITHSKPHGRRRLTNINLALSILQRKHNRSTPTECFLNLGHALQTIDQL